MSNHTSNLVSRLRHIGRGSGGYELSPDQFQAVAQAADEIERLNIELEKYRRWAESCDDAPETVAELTRLRQFKEWAEPQLANPLRLPDETNTGHADLLAKIPRVDAAFAEEVQKLSRHELERRVLIQKDWLGSYAQSLDGLGLQVGVEACRDPMDIRRIVTNIMGRSEKTSALHGEDCNCEACAETFFKNHGHYPTCTVYEGIHAGHCNCKEWHAKKTSADPCPVHTQPGHPFADCTCSSRNGRG